jgi:tRNA (cytidine/uridine-2'-O-)-methyltransferase
MINIALYQPDIPQNTAAIIRICACLNVNLEIIKPLGYVMNYKKLDRIYMDYLKECNIKYYDNFDEFLKEKDLDKIILLTTKSNKPYFNFQFKNNDTLLFGSETKGVPKKIHDILINKVNIPISKKTRSLNLASAVSVAAGEATRQLNYAR